jgi:cytochrome bd-type quinol oxidase subunit 2
MVATAALSFPALLRSAEDPALSITAYTAANDAAGLGTAIVWWCIGMPLAITYFVIVFSLHRGKVRDARQLH